mgnify:CR=1 FL=1
MKCTFLRSRGRNLRHASRLRRIQGATPTSIMLAVALVAGLLATGGCTDRGEDVESPAEILSQLETSIASSTHVDGGRVPVGRVDDDDDDVGYETWWLLGAIGKRDLLDPESHRIAEDAWSQRDPRDPRDPWGPRGGASGGIKGASDQKKTAVTALDLEPALRQRAVQSLVATVRLETGRMANAAAKGAIREELQLDARLAVLHDDLRTLLPSTVPEDRLELLDRRSLEMLLERAQNLLRSAASKGDAGVPGVWDPCVQYWKSRVDQLNKALGAGQQFSLAHADLLDVGFDETKWIELSADRADRTEIVFKGMIEKLNNVSPHLEGFLLASAPRGPPSDLERTIHTAITEFFTSPFDSLVAESRLVALHDVLHAEIKNLDGASPFGMALRLADREYLRRIRHDLRFMHAEHMEAFGGLVVDDAFDRHAKAWLAAIDRELAHDRVQMRTEDVGAISQRALQSVGRNERELTPAALDWFISALSERYPRTYWPRACTELAARHLGNQYEQAALRLMTAHDTLLEAGNLTARGLLSLTPEEARTLVGDIARVRQLGLATRTQLAEARGVLDADLGGEPLLTKLNSVAILNGPRDEPPGGIPPRFDPPPKQPLGTAASAWSPVLPRPPPAVRSEAATERTLAGVEARLDDLASRIIAAREAAAKDQFFAENPYKQLGRRVVSRDTVATAEPIITRQPSRTRQTSELHEWDSFRNDAGKFYSISDVLDLKHFDSLGGGIHFGAPLTVDAPGIKLSSWGLFYNLEQETIELRELHGTRRVPVMRIDPETLQPLVGFAATKRNLAVTIGWVGEGGDPGNTDGQPILLDPYLIDTRSGGDLVDADVLPWSLDQATLPNRAPNPISAQFSEAYATDITQCEDRARVEEFVSRSIAALDHETPLTLVNAILASTEKDLRSAVARVERINGRINELVQRVEKDLEAIERTLELLQQQGLSRQDALRFIQKNPSIIVDNPSGRGGLVHPDRFSVPNRRQGFRGMPLDRQQSQRELELLEDQYIAAVRTLGKRVSSWWAAWVSSVALQHSQTPEFIIAATTRPGLLKGPAFEHFDIDRFMANQRERWLGLAAQSGSLPPYSVALSIVLGHAHDEGLGGDIGSLWFALTTRHVSGTNAARMPEHKDALVAYGLDYANPTTLAVLLPEPVTLRITPDEASLDGGMRYAYLTGNYRVETYESPEIDKWRVHGRLKDDGRNTRVLETLTSVVNEHRDDLRAAFPPLGRVEEYSRAVSLIRWAMAASKTGTLGLVDLSALAGTVGQSRERFPTPDALGPGR